MFEQIIFAAIASAGLSLSWHAFLEDRPSFKKKCKSLSKVATCGICQIFWLTLLFSFFVLTPFALEWREVSFDAVGIGSFIVTWQATAFLGCTLRYGALLVLELAKTQYRNNQS